MYKIIDLNNFKKIKQYEWFHTFSNPCYGFNVKMDVTNVVKYSKDTKTSFFINTLFLVTKGMNMVEEMRLREVDGEIRLYDVIDPAFIVMTNNMVFENAEFEMTNDYKEFYKRAKSVIDNIKNQNDVMREYNKSDLYNQYYITCIPWLEISSMTHPIPNGNYNSLSCPRVCWDKYHLEDGRYFLTLNITVNHCFVDGYPLSTVFNYIKTLFENCEKDLSLQ